MTTIFVPTPKNCDICKGTLGSVMYDARVAGAWGCTCHACFTAHGGKLGMGKGQKYKRTKEGFALVE